MKTRLKVTVTNGLNGCNVEDTIEFKMPTKEQLEMAGMIEDDYKEKMAKELFFEMVEFCWDEV